MLGAVPAVSAAQEIITDEFRYTLTDTHAIVKGPGSGMESVTEIPAEIRGLPVREIADHAFWRNTSLTEITIPDSVRVFGNSAFRDCTNLQAVHYSGTPEMIENDVFSGVGLSARPENVDEYGNVYAGNILVKIGADKKGICRVRAGTVAVVSDVLAPDFEYHGFLEVKELYFPDIGDRAFMSCSKLLSVELPDGLERIEAGTFSSCRRMRSVEIPASVKEIGESAFTDDLFVKYRGTVVYTGQKAYYFEDDAKISKWAWDYVYMCQATGLVQGKNGNVFDPQGVATRAEVATILHNLHSKYMLLK